MLRREFLKLFATSMTPLIVRPAPIFIPPREPFVRMGRPSLSGLVSHLGIMPTTNELSICEGVIEDMREWDGVGYPCLVRNVCSYPQRMVWIYDLDLWNFRHDDEFGPVWKRPDFAGCNSHAEWHAKRRFGADYEEAVRRGGGWLGQRLAGTS